MHKKKGMVLLGTISIIVIISLLILTSLQQNSLYAKALGRMQIKDRYFYQMEQLALRLLREKSASCMIKKDDTHNIRNQLPEKGCGISEQDMQYKYLIEEAGIYPCLLVKTADKYQASRHLHLYLMAINTQLEVHDYLEIHNIEAAETKEPCMRKETVIPWGIQSWNYGSR